MSVERKLATVVFVDLVASTALVTASDPEVARRRVTQFFDGVSRLIEGYGGTVEKFAGDAVMAAFGVPRAHEDDAERALRASIEILGAVRALGLECRVGVEAGEVVSEDAESTFATGEAVSLAARLQQAADPDEILVGPRAYRLASNAIRMDPAGARILAGFGDPVPVWRAVATLEPTGSSAGASTGPMVGRGAELDLLRNSFDRTVRDARAQLFTIYGEPGIGKSRLAREFVDRLEGAKVLVGRCLPYGEGITYWPLAEMVKSASEIADNDPAQEAREKLRESCEDEAVAELLALATGVLEAVETDRSQQEIAWAAREWAENLAATQPLVLAFEDIHWGEEPMLSLIEHLATWVRGAPLLILCLARPELLDVYPGWGGGRLRATAIELGALPREDADQLVAALLADAAVSAEVRREVLAKTEGNPLFIEETAWLLAEGGDGQVVIPDTVQALIAARIDRLPRASKMVLRHAAVIGRVSWRDAVADLSSGVGDIDLVLDDLLMRDFLLRESRSSIAGEHAFRFKHMLIREIAYSGLAKGSRAELHAAFAAWLTSRGVEELVEIRSYHLDQAVMLLGELEGAAPGELVREAALALETAGRRALAREANRSGRRLLSRAVELEPTLERRFHAARAAWRLDDIPAVSVEMERVRVDAREAGDRRIEGRALIALGEVTAFREADNLGSRALIEEGLALLGSDDFIGRSDALRQLATLSRWLGDWSSSLRFGRQAFDVARQSGRKDLMSGAANALADVYLWQFDLDRAEELAVEALQLADESGGIVPRGHALHVLAQAAELKGDHDLAMTRYDQAIALFAEAGASLDQARALNHLGELVLTRGDDGRAERLVREAMRMLQPLGDRGYLCESQRLLAEILLRQGKVDEAERHALHATETVGPQDALSRATTRTALALVRDSQSRDEEAEALFREAVALAADCTPRWIHELAVRRLVQFLRRRGRLEEAAELDARMESTAGSGKLAVPELPVRS